ncbi:hypothetical protein [Noviherbaspirillum malthae]|uniref:hypothetical protein n=1 Tax=Noviherbaspirillum malthae TaxID=1260987 RepID=UPI00188EB0AC|nr:hypothetical protein [Noviherbaspirillum malthae]
MKPLQRIVFLLVILLFTGLLARWWLSTGMSESIWTWINGLIESGQNPGLASDIELLVTLVCELLVSTIGVMLIRPLVSCIRKKI